MSKLFEVIDGKVIVTTSTGARVECLPYADDLMRAGTALVLPDKPEAPTYVLGEPEEGEREIRVPYTATSIDDEKTPAEDTEAWGQYVPLLLAYNLEVKAIEEKQGLMRARVLIHKATRVIDQPDLHEWAKQQEEFYGIPMPEEDEEALLLQYFGTEVSKGTDDMLLLMAGVMRATGVTEEVLDAFESNFRDQMGDGAGADTETDSGDAPETAEDGTEGLVDGATVEPA